MPNTPVTSVRISLNQRDKLITLAEELGYLYGGKGSISKLMEAIADDKLAVLKKEKISDTLEKLASTLLC